MPSATARNTSDQAAGDLTAADLTETLRVHRLLVVVRGDDPERLAGCVEALADAGATAIEISLSTPGGIQGLRLAAARHRDRITLGAGTVISADDARHAADAGAAFLVTPCLGPGADIGGELGLPVLPGVHTPTEIAAAQRHGLHTVKLFPASLGGPNYLAAVLQPFPTLAAVPVGGIQLDEARRYLDAGALAVGIGSPLLQDAVHGGDLAALTRRTQRLLSNLSENTELP